MFCLISKISTVYVEPRDLPMIRLSSEPYKPLILPLKWSKYEGAYTLSMTLGSSIMTLVVDSGSAHCSVQGESCIYRKCNRLKQCKDIKCPCGEIVCPFYKADKSKLIRHSWLQRILIYGSQENEVKHYVDTIKLGSKQSEPCVIYVIDKIKGDTTSSILGLALLHKTKSSSISYTFLDAYWKNNSSSKSWTIWFENKKARITFDPIDIEPMTHIPLVPLSDHRLSLLSRVGVNFYMTELIAIGLSYNDDERWWSIDQSIDHIAYQEKTHFPRFCLWDTGTLLTMSCNQVGNILSKELNYNPSRDRFHLLFKNYTRLSWEPNEISNALYISDSSLSGFNESFQGINILLIGLQQMRSQNSIYSFDLDHNIMSIS